MKQADLARKTRYQPDPIARQVAAEIRETIESDLVILFGSRTRGDYDPDCSDIDVMLVERTETDLACKELHSESAQMTAENFYGQPVNVQLVWRDIACFRCNRRYVNSLETNAVHEGIIMPRYPETYTAADYQDADAETEYDWGEYDIRLADAENHLDEFKFLAENRRSDLVIGQHARSALEHALKALLAAHGAPYTSARDISELLDKARICDPELAKFRLAIPAEIYSAYDDRREPLQSKHRPKLCEQDGFASKTVADSQFIIHRARDARQQMRGNE